MLDVQNEQVMRLHEARQLPYLRGRGGGRLDIGTLRRWAMRGVRNVVLETVTIGGVRCTTVEAVQRFIARLNDPTHTDIQPSSRRKRDIAADQRLDAAGM